MPVADHLSRSRVAFEEARTLVAVIDMSLSSWVVLGLQGTRAPAGEEARGGRGGSAVAGAPVAGRGRAAWLSHGAYLRCLRGGAGRVLARSLARGSRDRAACHPRQQHSREAGAAPSEDRPSGLPASDASLRRLAAWRGRALPDGRAVPSIEAEDAKTPNRERAARSRECTRVINRMKSTLARLGIRGFKPDLKKAARRLDDLRLPTGEALPPNARAELRRDMALLRVLREADRGDQGRPRHAPRGSTGRDAPREGPDAGRDPGSWGRNGGHARQRGVFP